MTSRADVTLSELKCNTYNIGHISYPDGFMGLVRDAGMAFRKKIEKHTRSQIQFVCKIV